MYVDQHYKGYSRRCSSSNFGFGCAESVEGMVPKWPPIESLGVHINWGLVLKGAASAMPKPYAMCSLKPILYFLTHQPVKSYAQSRSRACSLHSLNKRYV